MAFVVKNDLNKFLSKINNVSFTDIKQKAIDNIFDKAYEIIKKEYDGVEGVIITRDKSKNHISINAHKEGLAYIEFGTGLIGETSGYPREKLPKESFIFQSPMSKKGEQTNLQFTQGWEYYYDNPKTKVLGGWFFGKTFMKGQKAGMQMFNATRKIVDYCNKELLKQIKEGK